jgi:hypothetical protein
LPSFTHIYLLYTYRTACIHTAVRYYSSFVKHHKIASINNRQSSIVNHGH